MTIVDDRRSLPSLYTAHQQLLDGQDWNKSVIFSQQLESEQLPVQVFTTKKQGKALWILAGIHGEEPAGPNAIADRISTIKALGTQFPIVLLPLCNPLGYVKNWRYPNEARDWKTGKSVGDAEHVLLDQETHNSARVAQSVSAESAAFISTVLELARSYPPLLSIDHHEDELLKESYIYSQGKLGERDPIAQRIITILQNQELPVQLAGKTRFGEEIHQGIVGQTVDGSVDELLASSQVCMNGNIIAGPNCPTSLVIETPATMALEKRIAAHVSIIEAYHQLFSIAQSGV